MDGVGRCASSVEQARCVCRRVCTRLCSWISKIYPFGWRWRWVTTSTLWPPPRREIQLYFFSSALPPPPRGKNPRSLSNHRRGKMFSSFTARIVIRSRRCPFFSLFVSLSLSLCSFLRECWREKKKKKKKRLGRFFKSDSLRALRWNCTLWIPPYREGFALL